MRLELESEANAPVAVLDESTEFHSEKPSDDPAPLLKKGIAAAQKGDREHARELLARAADLDPASEDAWMWLASISEYPEELLAFLSKVLLINPDNQRAGEWHAATRSLLAKTFVQRGIAAHNEGDPELANSCFDQALGHDDKCAVAWFWKAAAASADEQKIEYLERAIELDPSSEAAQQALASLKPPTHEANIEEAKWAAVAGKRDDALEILDEVLANGHGTAEAWVLRSHLSVSLDDKIDSLEKALALEPDNQFARASHDFLTATVRDVAEEQSVEQDAAGDQAEFDEQVESVDQTAVEPIDEPASEGCAIEEVFVSPVQEIDQNDLTVANVPGSPFDETVDDVAATEAWAPVYKPFVEELVNAYEAVIEEPAQVYEPASEDTHPDDLENEYEVIDAAEIFAEQVDETIESPAAAACAFCNGPVDAQAFKCGHCNAVLTLSDIESLLANPNADRDTVQQSISRMEAEWNMRDFDVHELTVLGIGHFNLRSFEKGLKYLQEGARLDPNNVILGGQINALAIRIDEMRRQEEIDESKPRGKSILVVDDSPTVRKLISAKLEKSGHNVTCASDGVEGLEKLDGELPDLVLLDIAMPRMDGYEVCKQIRSNPAAAHVPVVMISGKDGFFDKVRGKMAGCTGYVTKPFGPETLMKALATYLLPENGHAE